MSYAKIFLFKIESTNHLPTLWKLADLTADIPSNAKLASATIVSGIDAILDITSMFSVDVIKTTSAAVYLAPPAPWVEWPTPSGMFCLLQITTPPIDALNVGDLVVALIVTDDEETP